MGVLEVGMISPGGVALSWIVGVPASVIFPCTMKSRRRLILAPAHSGSPRKRAVKWLCVWCCKDSQWLGVIFMDWMCSQCLPNDEDARRYTNHQYINSQSQIAVSAMKVDLTWTFGFLADTDGALANVTATGLWNCNTKCHQIHDHINARSDAKTRCFAAISQLYSWLLEFRRAHQWQLLRQIMPRYDKWHHQNTIELCSRSVRVNTGAGLWAALVGSLHTHELAEKQSWSVFSKRTKVKPACLPTQNS